MIVEVEGIRVAVTDDVTAAAYLAVDRATAELPVSGDGTGPRRVAVEVHHRLGGHPQRALLGAALAAGPAQRLYVDVGISTALVTGAAASCPGSFGRSLVPGLPPEFVGAVLGGLLEGRAVAGSLVVDRSAHDPVESSPFAYRVTAGVVMELLSSAPAEAERRLTARLRALLR